MQDYKLATIWHDIMNAAPIAGGDTRDNRENDRLAQPGYVGSHYNGTLLIGMNPGAGGESESVANEGVFVALRRLRDDGDHLRAFQALNVALAKAIPTWSIYRNLVAHILRSAQMELHDVAWINLLKWRTASGVNPVTFYETSWEKHTGAQIEALEPKYIIMLGAGTGDWFRKKYRGGARVKVIPRTRGDRYLSDRTAAAIRELNDASKVDRTRLSRVEFLGRQSKPLSKSPPGLRGGLHHMASANYPEFWRTLLEEADKRTVLFRGVNPSKKHWLQRTVQGLPNVWLIFAVKRNESWVELCIQRRRGESQAIMDSIEQEKGKIECAFGEELRWDRESDRKGNEDRQRCKIMSRVFPLGIESKDQRGELQGALIESMVRFAAALGGCGCLPKNL